MLHINNVSMIYKKEQKKALTNINLDICEGEFTALLGQNGAGKSTLINILAGNVKKTQGRVTIGGYDLDDNELETKRIIGIVPQDTGYDFVFTVDEALKKQSGYFGIKNNKKVIDDLLETLYLTDKRNTRLRDLSGGMRRRFLIAKALVHQPKILILDEPTAGVDIEMRRILYDILIKLHESGTTIILTTHYIEEAEKLCKRIVIIDGGQVIADAPKDQLMQTFSREIGLEIEFDQEISKKDFSFLKDFEIVDKRHLKLTVVRKELVQIFKKLSEEDLVFTDLMIERPKLEDVYLKMIRR